MQATIIMQIFSVTNVSVTPAKGQGHLLLLSQCSADMR